MLRLAKFRKITDRELAASGPITCQFGLVCRAFVLHSGSLLLLLRILCRPWLLKRIYDRQDV